MKMLRIIYLGCLLIAVPGFAQKKSYLHYVKTHCDNLIAHGSDTYGPQTSCMLASVIDTRDMHVPRRKVPATEGTRPSDRAVGGSNFYHDVALIGVLGKLTELTGEKKYREALHAYAHDFLKYSQNPHTGLLGWGEHVYYNFYEDTVMEGDSNPNGKHKSHEFLESTPPWPFLWQIDSAATRKAIAGVRYHFRSGVTQSFLFNRHARWQKIDTPEYRGLEQYQDGGQAWIKHSGLQCYSFSFLYSKTGEKEWKRWLEGSGNLYWNYRNPETDLTISCIDDPRPSGVNGSLNGASLLAYYLLQTSRLHPELRSFKDKAEKLLKAAEKYSWNPSAQGYHSEVSPEGKVTNTTLIPVIHTGYGGADILMFGRVAAYFYKITGDPAYRTMVKKVADQVRQVVWPENFVMNSAANTILFSLDAAEVLNDDRMVQYARKMADTGVQKLWSGRLFVRQPGDPYYESKLGANDFVAGLLRLHLLDQKDAKAASLVNWNL